MKRNREDGQLVPAKCYEETFQTAFSNAYLNLQDAKSDKDPWGNLIPMPNVKFILDTEKNEVVEISDEEIEKRELISVKEYDEKIDELKNSKQTFRRFAQMAKEQQKERDDDEMSIE